MSTHHTPTRGGRLSRSSSTHERRKTISIFLHTHERRKTISIFGLLDCHLLLGSLKDNHWKAFDNFFLLASASQTMGQGPKLQVEVGRELPMHRKLRKGTFLSTLQEFPRVCGWVRQKQSEVFFQSREEKCLGTPARSKLLVLAMVMLPSQVNNCCER